MSVSFTASSSPKFTNKYDASIQHATDLFTPGVDWLYYKAQFYQESRLNPDAISPVGARGIAQFMPGTWKDMSVVMNVNGSPHDPELSILLGVRYMAQLRRTWRANPKPNVTRSDYDRHSLALCSYNAGAGNCLKAQKLCNNAVTWVEIKVCLPAVTGKHHKETWDYQNKIMHQWYTAMKRESLF